MNGWKIDHRNIAEHPEDNKQGTLTSALRSVIEPSIVAHQGDHSQSKPSISGEARQIAQIARIKKGNDMAAILFFLKKIECREKAHIYACKDVHSPLDNINPAILAVLSNNSINTQFNNYHKKLLKQRP